MFNKDIISDKKTRQIKQKDNKQINEVMIIDDLIENNQKEYKRNLNSYSFLYFNNPKDAIKKLKNAEPTLIFLDHYFPGITGYKIAKIIVNMDRDHKIIINSDCCNFFVGIEVDLIFNTSYCKSRVPC